MSGQRKLTTLEQSELAHTIGLDLFKEKKFREALEKFSLAIELNPKSVDAYISRAHAYQQLALQENKSAACRNLFDLSTRDIIQASKLDPKKKPALVQNAYLLGQQLHENKNFAEAVYQFDLVSTLDPLFINAYIARGNIFLERSQPIQNTADQERVISAAVTEYENALKIDTNNKKALTQLGKTLCMYAARKKAAQQFKYANELFEKSFQVLAQLTKKYPDDAEGFHLLGNTLFMQYELLKNTPQSAKKLADAIKYYNTAYVLNPEHQTNKTNRDIALCELNGGGPPERQHKP